MNPCRCGRADEPGFTCRRRPNARCAADYQARISGPLIDRIDLHIEVPAVTAADLILPPPTEGSREVAERVAQPANGKSRVTLLWAAARPQQRAVSGAILEDVARPDASGLTLLRDAADAMRLSARGYHRVLGSRARLPISTAPTKSAASISPRRCPTGRSRRNQARGVTRPSLAPVALIAPRMPIADKNS